MILETEIDALDITVLEGGGDEVGTWARDNGFLLTPDAPEMLDFYGHRSQIFMAARFDAARAAELGQTAGDGTPDHADDPHRCALGAPADPQPRARGRASSSRPTCSSSPTRSRTSWRAGPA